MMEEIYNPYGKSNCIIQDKKGYIWCGTNEGISRFDGFNFIAAYTGVPVKAIAEDIEGNIWGGTINGELIKYSRSSGNIKIYKLKADPLFYYKPVEFNKVPNEYFYNKSLTVTSLLIHSDTLYAGTWGSGIFLFSLSKDQQVEHLFNLKDEKSLPGNYITSLVYNAEDTNVICGSFDAGIIMINTNKKEYYQTITDHQVTSICYDGKEIWAGTLQGLIKFSTAGLQFTTLTKKSVTNIFYKDDLIAAVDSGTIFLLDIKTGTVKSVITYSLPGDNNYLLSMMVDKTGIIWGSTSAGLGLIKWKRSSDFFSYYQLPGITSFAQSKSGDLYVGTINNGLYKYSFQTKVYNLVHKDIQDIEDLLYSIDGNLYIVSSGKLILYNEKKDKFSNLFTESNISSLAQTPDGNIWAGTSGDGVIKMSAGKYIYYRKSNIYPGSIPDNYVKKLFLSGNELWGYTREGFLFQYLNSKDEFVSWRLKENQTNILTVYPNKEFFYIGTYGDGIYKFNKPDHKFYSIDLRNISGFRNIYGILEDNNNNLWLSTESGVLQYNTSRHQLFYNSRKDGIDEKQFNPSVQYIANNYYYLFGGMTGFVLFRPGEKQQITVTPEMTITSFKVLNNERILTSLPVELSSNENSLSFRFACLDFNDPQKNQYKWILKGYDKENHYSYGSLNIAEYNQLAPGEYIFKLQGANASGVWSKEIVAKVIIALPFYQNWWFILLSILVVIALPGYYLYLRLQNLIAIREIKSKLSADLHDDIGSGLTEISLIAELLKNNPADKQSTDNQLQFISQRARELVNNMSDIVWLVNPKECTLAELVIRLRNKCLTVTDVLGINLLTEVNEESEEYKLTMEKKQNIYLILKEAVNNSIKYSKGTNIKILINIDEKRFSILVTDDGVGFNPSDVQMGNGIRNMIRRASDIKAELHIKSFKGTDDRCGTSIILSGKL